MGDVASSAPLRVLVAVPALEALLFLRPDPVARAFGEAASDEHMLELGRLNPREALKRLDPGGHWWTASLNLVRTLNGGDISRHPAQLDLSPDPRRSAVRISALATGPPAGVGGRLGPFLAA